MNPYNISQYRIFISHSYAYFEEYLRLVAMLDRAAERDPTWRWENLSVPLDFPLMTDEEAEQAEIYINKMMEQKALVHAVLLIVRSETVDSESVFLELYEAMPRGRPEVPVIGILPRGQELDGWNDQWGVVTVKWHSKSIIQAIREYATPTTVDELRLNAHETAERRRIVATLEENDWHRKRTAQALGIGRTTLWNKMRNYIIQQE